MNSEKSIFVFEWFFSGQGFGTQGTSNPSLAREGYEMFTAVANDILRCDRWKVHGLSHPKFDSPANDSIQMHRCQIDHDIFEHIHKIGQQTDYTLLIAPETAGSLHRCAVEATKHGICLLSPDCEFIDLASDKWSTFQFLRSHNVPTIRSQRIAPSQNSADVFHEFAQDPWVIKPIDGCGSQGIAVGSGPSELQMFLDHQNSLANSEPWIIQPLVPGKAVSIGILDGRKRLLLPASEQVFDSEPFGAYIESHFSLSENERSRAAELAQLVVNCVPPTQGYWGIDLILGHCKTGVQDVVVEINPRITSSYSRIAQYVNFNLGERMLENALR